MKNKRAERDASFHVTIMSAVVFSAMSYPSIILAQDIETQANATLETVVVTGEKIQRKQQETLSSVAVVTARDMREHGDKTLSDVLARTPGVYSTAGNETFGIRGIPEAGLSDTYGSSDVITTYMDDTPQSRRRSIFSPFSTWDLDQVEVFMGPQSTVQGRNALGGAIVMRSKDPTYRTERAVRVNAGNYDSYGGSLLWNGAIVKGVAAGRLALDYQESDGFIKNTFLNNDANSNHAFNARGKLLVQPSEHVDVLLTLSHQDSQLGQRAVNLLPSGDADFWNLSSNIDAYEKIKQDSLAAKVDARLSELWTLTGIFTGSKENYRTKQDFEPTITDMDDAFFIENDNKTHTQELRLAYGTQAIKGHVGLYHARNQDDEDASVPAFAAYRFRDTTIDNRAIFGELEWNLPSNWQLIAGLRYDRERNENTQRDYYPDEGIDNTVVNDETFDAVLPKIGVAYLFSPEHRIGFVVQRGYRAGGASYNYAADTSIRGSVPYDPEYTTNYELAWRNALLGNRLRLSANLYYTQWRDQQVEVQVDPGDDQSTEVRNAGSSKLHGLEFSAAYQATNAVKLYANAAYNHTEYENFVFLERDLSGKPFMRAPKFKAALGSVYRFSEDWRLAANIVYQSDSVSFYLPDGSERKADDSVLVNLNLEKPIGDRALVSAFVKNLFNDKYITNNQNSDVIDVGAPRIFGAEVKVNW